MNSRWGRAIVQELSASGVGHFFVCPGSRSTPLALAVADCGYPHTIHYDERGAAFAALGYGLETGRPAAWLTTSGTAVANGYPAVVEASVSQVPLVLLTADRPPELRNTGANQTIDQVGIFGSYVREFVDIPTPGGDLSEAGLRNLIKDAMIVRMPGPGPVHLNCMFRKPLISEESGDEIGGQSPQEEGAQTGAMNRSSRRPIRRPPDHAVDEIAGLLSTSDRILILAGGGLTADDDEAITELAGLPGCLVFPDVRNSLRRGRHSQVIKNFDLLLQSGNGGDRPDAVVHVGERMTSKHAYIFVNDDAIRQVRIDAWGKVVDPDRRIGTLVAGDVGVTLREVGRRLAGERLSGAGDKRVAYVQGWQEANARVGSTLETISELTRDLTEPAVARVVSRLMPGDSNLILAASMPVRDMDSYAVSEGLPLKVFANRGASGIDGTVATASGISIANGRPTTVLTGDLAMLHDLNSLALIPDDVPFVLVVINNDGGGIFSFLPVAGKTSYFEKMFGTPHGLTFEAAAEMFGLAYTAPGTLSDFEVAYSNAIGSGRTLIEIRTDRSENVAVHKRILSRLASVGRDS